MQSCKSIGMGLATGLVFATMGVAQAHGNSDHAATGSAVKPVMQERVPELPNSSVLLATVHYAPGGTSAAHMHPGSVFAYVLEGAVVSQLGGGKEQVFTQGQAWYEPAGTHHLVSHNASADKPATLLVFGIVADGQQLTVPIGASQ
ncbi:cupin domain-containing protein [Ralstonia insidiosa]|uniref:Cupin type-2 domain-containing protein n=1 Tax=Ralstonia insidiosa TaxID=190721 RepID=A0A192A1N2_9RALS|nr:cupin domain-containing protein [Ralstonia insidiosa]ANJ74181.1 hypothetical protein A9Y76_17755 [Ralstonia insidiosa]